jgi:hypothetical protein
MVSCTLIENAAGSGGSAIHVVDGSHVELENTDVSGGEPSSGIDGYVGTTCSAGLSCSAVDAARWTGGGTISISYEDCVVETETMTWGEMKSHYR